MINGPGSDSRLKAYASHFLNSKHSVAVHICEQCKIQPFSRERERERERERHNLVISEEINFTYGFYTQP